MKQTSLLVFFLLPIFCHSQSLGPERVQKLKESVVRVLIDGQACGTAFFITPDGALASCWHVIEPAIVRDKNSNNIINVKRIEIEFPNEKRLDVSIHPDLIQKAYIKAVSYDFAVLVTEKPKSNFSFLKLGDFNKIKEGDAIYSNGYPLGIKQNFISMGILSTKWIDTIQLSQLKTHIGYALRHVAWLDLTMNRGNSGGPIIKIGKTPEQDEVIGIATFILNPFAQEAEKLATLLNNDRLGFVETSGLNMNKINAFLADAISKNSIGVSGCVSINHLLNSKKE